MIYPFNNSIHVQKYSGNPQKVKGRRGGFRRCRGPPADSDEPPLRESLPDEPHAAANSMKQATKALTQSVVSFLIVFLLNALTDIHERALVYLHDPAFVHVRSQSVYFYRQFFSVISAVNFYI